MAKSTMADHGPRSTADPTTDSYSLTAVVVKWKDVRSGFCALTTIHQDPGTRSLSLDLERTDLERTDLDINPGRRLRVKQSFVAEFRFPRFTIWMAKRRGG